MKIIHTFSSQKFTKLKDMDVAIWYMGCLCYKALGYKLKLYCTEEDIPFLFENHLLRFYDEIDTLTFVNSDILNSSRINHEAFWFLRKVAAMNNEFEVANEPFVYSDTDIFIFEPIDISDCDVLVWCNEKVDHLKIKSTDMYCEWKYLSTPKNYVMPKYIKKTTVDNYNTGLLYFKDKNMYRQYVKDMLDFIIDNPCECTKPEVISICEGLNDKLCAKVFSMNAEQRILKGVCNHNKLKVNVFDENGLWKAGISEKGSHYFLLKPVWSSLKNLAKDQQNFKNDKVSFSLIYAYNFVEFFERTLRENELTEDYNFFMNKETLKKLHQITDVTNTFIDEA